MPLDRARHPSLMCLTQDRLPISHVEQCRRLCGAGARWIQLRMKEAALSEWMITAAAVLEVCRGHDAICIINDRVDVALAVGADGVHLGRGDGDWRDARERLGPQRILGGTVNSVADAQHAVEVDCLDYVGVGPWRHTTNKKNLAPILGPDGVRMVVQRLEGLPAWAIGGIEASDLSAVRAAGAAGVAVSTALLRGGQIEGNLRAFATAAQPAPVTA